MSSRFDSGGARASCAADNASPARTALAIANFLCYKIDMSETPEPFNGAELSESVLARDWNSPEEDAAWADL
jgi:hypothetical protein